MKKITKILTCITMCFSFSGCFSSVYSRNATNKIESVCSDCKTVDSTESLVSNVEKVMRKVNAVKGTYNLTNTKTSYLITFDMITKEQKLNWDMVAKGKYDDKEISLYLKDSKFYVVYPNNGANVILKDDLTNMVIEIESTLDALNATYDKENLNDIITGDKLAGLNLEKLKEEASYVLNSDKTYTVTYSDGTVTWEYKISSNYLIKEIKASADNFTSVLTFEYPKTVNIEYPNGLDFLTLDIEDAKRLLEVDNFAYLIDPDLKDK